MEKQSRFWKILNTVMRIVNRFTEDNISLYSAQTSFFLVVSLIPFAIVLIPLLSIFIPDNAPQLLEQMVLTLPGSLGEIADDVLQTLFKMPDTSVISLYMLVSLWAASKGIMSLQTCLHGICHIKETENYFVRRGRCTLYTLVFVLALVFALILLVMGNSLEQLLGDDPRVLAQIARIILLFRPLITLAVFIAAFTSGYRFLSGNPFTFWEALPGVLLTTFGWMIFSWIYSLYITNLSRYITLYGSLGALVFLFLWLYFCVLIMMIGAEFNQVMNNRRILRARVNDMRKANALMEESRVEDFLADYQEDE